MMASGADRKPENGRKIAARVSMLTPGMAPNSRPPISPQKKMKTLSGLLTRVAAPSRNMSMPIYPEP